MERGHSDDFAAELASTLAWWEEAGVDALVGDQPRDWLKAPSAPAASPVIPANAGISRGERAPVSRDPGFRRDDALPDQLPLFHDWLRASDALPFAAPAAPRVCPVGDPASGLMIMVAMPSTDDCAAGTLLSAAPGRLFDRMLAAIGRSRETIYLAGLSCLRAPAGRFDEAGAARCAEIARHHVGLVAPRALLLMGEACTRALLGLGAAQARGRVHQVETAAGPVKAVATLPPDYLLAQPAAKALAWADLQLLMEELK